MPTTVGRRAPSHGRFRIALAGSAICAALLVAAAGFMQWMSITSATGEFADGLTVTGWGLIGGSGELAGSNINQVLDALQQPGNYRQAQLPTVLAGMALIPAIWLIFKLCRVAAASLMAVGFLVLLWGGFRGLFPGDLAGILEPGEAHAAIGPWMVAVGGIEMLIVGVVFLLGAATPAVRPVTKRSRDIQPRKLR